MDAIHWGSLVAQVEEQLHAMSPDDFRAGAHQLQMLAHAEAAKRGEHAPPPNFVAAGQPIVQPYDGTEGLQLSASVSFSPVKSSRAGAAAATPAWQHLHPTVPSLPPGVSLHPSMRQPLPPPTPAFAGFATSTFHPVSYPSALIYTPTRTSVQHQGFQTATPGHPFDSFTLDLGAATPILHRPPFASPVSYQPAALETKQRTRTAPTWSDICFSEPSEQGKAGATQTVRPERKRRQRDTIDAGAGASQPKAKKKKAKAKAKATAKKPAAKVETIYVVAGLSNLDIICGRGGLANKYVGNKRFRDEVKKSKLREQYRNDSITNEQKRLVAQKLVELVKGYGGRFVKKGGDGKWRKMNAEDVHKKAVAALREIKW